LLAFLERLFAGTACKQRRLKKHARLEQAALEEEAEAGDNDDAARSVKPQYLAVELLDIEADLVSLAHVLMRCE